MGIQRKMKIGVFYTTVGAGHKVAAEAIYQQLKQQEGVEVKIADALDFTTPAFSRSYNQGYNFLITKMIWVWRCGFYILNSKIMLPAIRLFHLLQNVFFARPLRKYLELEQFDCIVSTHFLPNEVASFLKYHKKIKSRIITVVSDYDPERIWVTKETDVYAVACDLTAQKMLKIGVGKEKIIITGIPTNKKFSIKKNVAQLKEKLSLDPHLFTVLIATGSFGIGPIEKLLDQLSAFQILIVCGQNKQLYEKLQARNSEKVKIFGFVKNIDELMAVSDIMITKPGGLSISEALVSNLPMIFFSPIPGQEAKNIEILRKYGIGQNDFSIGSISATIKDYHDHPEKLQSVKKKIAQLARPEAAAKIAEICLEK